MEEKQTNLNELVIGIKEATKLKPAVVKIVKAAIESVGEKGHQKLVCEVEHPEKSDGTIKISDAKMEIREMLKVFPLWFNKDEDGLIRKGSTLALFLQSAGVSNVVGLIGKTMTTTEDSNGYLVFKAY